MLYGVSCMRAGQSLVAGEMFRAGLAWFGEWPARAL